MPREEWDQAFEHIIPVVGTSLAAVSLAMGLIALGDSSPLAQRVYGEDGRYRVSVRYLGRWYDLQDFVQPDDPGVVAAYSRIGPDVWGCLDFVCQSISYRRDVGEFWSFPAETLKRTTGDCEDSSILLASLLRNFTNAYVAIGNLQGFGHAWVVNGEGEVLEATYTKARRVPNPGDYCTYGLFNDQEVLELWPGALDEVFKLDRDEKLKLELMAKTLEAA